MEQNRTPLLDAITEYIDTNPAYFRIPGHRLNRGISKKWTDQVGTEIFKYDVTETPMTDDLHNPEGAILKAQELAAELYGAQKSFFLVNGTTCGNEAMIMSAVKPGEKIMVARNAHKSAMMGLIISGARPVYVMPKVYEEWGIQGGVTPDAVEKMFQKHPDCKALFLVSPTYYGICSDLKKIADICHRNNALLLVDEAHGGHLYFKGEISKMPHGALEQGADLCVQSMHKITGALTQSSILHIGSKRVDPAWVSSNLHIVQSTSPSYLLMTSLDCSRYELAVRGASMVKKAYELARKAKEEIRNIPHIKCMEGTTLKEKGIAGIDQTRLVISAKDLGLTGYELDEILFRKYHVDMELADAYNVLAIITYANEENDIERLIQALKDISDTFADKKKKYEIPNVKVLYQTEQKLTPREAYYEKKKAIPWEKSIGCISAEMLAPYPPGIPVLYPGEVITKEIWKYMEQYRIEGHHMHGPADPSLKTIQVINL